MVLLVRKILSVVLIFFGIFLFCNIFCFSFSDPDSCSSDICEMDGIREVNVVFDLHDVLVTGIPELACKVVQDHVPDCKLPSNLYEKLMHIFTIWCPICESDGALCVEGKGKGALHLKKAWLSDSINEEELLDRVLKLWRFLDRFDWGKHEFVQFQRQTKSLWYWVLCGVLTPEHAIFLQKICPEDVEFLSKLGGDIDIEFLKSFSDCEIFLISKLVVIILTIEKYIRHSGALEGGVALLNLFKTLNTVDGGEIRYNLFVLSNSMDKWVLEYMEILPDLFDGVQVITSEMVGAIKPDPEAFETFLIENELSPHTCVVVDDKEKNVTVAEGLGMLGICWDNKVAKTCFIAACKRLYCENFLTEHGMSIAKKYLKKFFVHKRPDELKNKDCDPLSPSPSSPCALGSDLLSPCFSVLAYSPRSPVFA